MKGRIEAIARLFGDNVGATIKENFAQLECEVKLTLRRTPDKDILPVLLPAISDRDTWRFQMITEGDEDLFDMRAGANIEEVCNENKLQPYYEDTVTLIYTITKNKVNDTLSVYDYNLFLNHIKGLTITETLNALQNQIVEIFVMEIWSEEYERFNTYSVAAIKKGDAQPRLVLNNDRKKRNEKCDELCQWNNKFTRLTPEDLYILNRDADGVLARIFDQLCLLLSTCYVADYSSLDKSGMTLRLSGYKMMIMELETVKASVLQLDTDSVRQWYKIYDWCYTGGYTSDRLSIARNIISLNCQDIDKLKLNESTLDSIKSNFKIFEKDNVRQYIKVRNDVSKTLLDMQEKVNAIVEGFTGDFQKSVISLGTFFLTVIVVRVIAKGDIAGAFTGGIALLSLAFIVLSAVNLVYSRKTLDRKERLFTKHYEQLKERYSQLLSEEEKQKMFEDSDPRKDGTHANYILWQKNRYTWIWAIALVVFAFLVAWLWCYNLFETSNIGEILKAIVKCFTKNT